MPEAGCMSTRIRTSWMYAGRCHELAGGDERVKDGEMVAGLDVADEEELLPRLAGVVVDGNIVGVVEEAQ